MDYRYYYETVEAERAGRGPRVRPLTVLAAGAAVEAVSLAAHAPGGTATGIACATAALAALSLCRCFGRPFGLPLGRILARPAAAGHDARITAPA